MSKQADAKAKQGYVSKAVPQTCGNCAHFASDITTNKPDWATVGWVMESSLRCLIGGFAVKKMGTCNEFAAKEPA